MLATSLEHLKKLAVVSRLLGRATPVNELPETVTKDLAGLDKQIFVPVDSVEQIKEDGRQRRDNGRIMSPRRKELDGLQKAGLVRHYVRTVSTEEQEDGAVGGPRKMYRAIAGEAAVDGERARTWDQSELRGLGQLRLVSTKVSTCEMIKHCRSTDEEDEKAAAASEDEEPADDVKMQFLVEELRSHAEAEDQAREAAEKARQAKADEPKRQNEELHAQPARRAAPAGCGACLGGIFGALAAGSSRAPAGRERSR